MFSFFQLHPEPTPDAENRVRVAQALLNTYELQRSLLQKLLTFEKETPNVEEARKKRIGPRGDA